MKKMITVRPPTKLELLTLRLMIFLGVAAMCFFLKTMFSPEIRGNGVLYTLLMITFVFSCLKILHEWIHYFCITVPETPAATKTYKVDIFTTFVAGEPYAMIKETLIALQAIRYPHKTYLCDEADDPHLKAFCERLGVYHMTRTEKTDAKAGNINNALRQSDGDLCVVLDPDHVPFPEFLDQIVPHFENPAVGFVQIVQAYKNHRESLIAKGAAQQTYQFYGPMMMSMNRYGTVQAIGANCTFRRTALESIGGHAAGLAEDMHTSMQLHAKGWKSIYVPAVLARGLVPSTLSAYYQQQLKWSRGVFDLLVTAYPRLFRQFTWKQKLHYAAIPLHYMSGLIALINFLIPVIALFFDKSPVYINISDFSLLLLPLTAVILLIRHFVQWWVMEDDERGFHVVGGLLIIGTWWVFLTGLVYTILRKKVPYVPTPKEGTEDSNWILNIPNLLILLISLAAIFHGLSFDWNPYNLAMSAFACINCLIVVFVIGASREQHFKRWKSRYVWLDKLIFFIQEIKGEFWILRRRVYAGIRNMALIITVISVATFAYFKTADPEETWSEQSYRHPDPDADTMSAADLPAGAFQDSSFVETPAEHTEPQRSFFAGVNGVNYSKGQDWRKKLNVFTKAELEADFAEMKAMRFNAIKRYGPNIYDRNVLKAARENGFRVHYGFWLPKDLDFKRDKKRLDELEELILTTVHDLKDHKEIVSWNLGNDLLQMPIRLFRQPGSALGDEAALKWLRNIVGKIKKADPGRPVTMDVNVSGKIDLFIARIHRLIPEIDAFGLVIGGKIPSQKQLKTLPAHYFVSYLPAHARGKRITENAAFVSNWQDERWSDRVSFDGIKDVQGRYKSTAYDTPFKILRPAAGTFAGMTLAYHAINKQNRRWALAGNKQYRYEWKLVRTDQNENTIAVNDVGSGPSLSLRIPQNAASYQLYLFVIQGDSVKSIVRSSLNTPLPADHDKPGQGPDNF